LSTEQVAAAAPLMRIPDGRMAPVLHLDRPIRSRTRARAAATPAGHQCRSKKYFMV